MSTERVRSAAVRYKNRIFAGINHREALAKMLEYIIYNEQDSQLNTDTGGDVGRFISILDEEPHRYPHVSGFITTSNRFFDRVRVVRIARKSGQLRCSPLPGESVTSEDIDMDGE